MLDVATEFDLRGEEGVAGLPVFGALAAAAPLGTQSPTTHPTPDNDQVRSRAFERANRF
jgi:hypothetical protein